MCLQTTWEKPKKAEKDIIVYKIVKLTNRGIKAPYNDFIYEPYKLYKTKMKLTDDFCPFDTIAQIARDNCNKNLYNIGQGFHSAKYKKRFARTYYKDTFIVKCIIPKGSLYYEGLTNLMVSNQIIITLEV